MHMTIDELFPGEDPVSDILAGVYGPVAKARAENGQHVVFQEDEESDPFVVYPMNSEGGIKNWKDGCTVVHGKYTKVYGRRARRNFPQYVVPVKVKAARRAK